MSDCVNISEVTTAAGWIAGLAIVALIATGWRKTARATAVPARARRPMRAHVGLEVTEQPAAFDRPVPVWRKVWAVFASTGLAVWVGAITATALGFGIAWLVITLTGMLKR